MRVAYSSFSRQLSQFITDSLSCIADRSHAGGLAVAVRCFRLHLLNERQFALQPVQEHQPGKAADWLRRERLPEGPAYGVGLLRHQAISGQRGLTPSTRERCRASIASQS